MDIVSITFIRDIVVGKDDTTVDSLKVGEEWGDDVVWSVRPVGEGYQINVSGCKTFIPMHNVRQVFYY